MTNKPFVRKSDRAAAILFLLWREVHRHKLHVTTEEAAELIGYSPQSVRSVVGKFSQTARFKEPDGRAFAGRISDGRMRASLSEFTDLIGSYSNNDFDIE